MKQSYLNPFLAAALLATAAHAADQTWIDFNANNDWNTSALNWDAGLVWTQGNVAIFGGTAETVTLTEAISAGGLTFNSGGYTLTGNTLTLAAGSIINTNANTATLNSNLAGSGGMVKSGSGTLALSGSNGYTGITTIDAGTLQISSPGALPATTAVALTTSGAKLTLGVPGQALAWVPGSAVAEAFHANSPTYKPENAIDGSLTTRWAGGTGHWIYADLGSSQSVGLFKINWEAARSTSFVIQTSDDAASWTNATGTLSSSAANVWETYNLNPGASGRYVRMLSAATVFGTGGGDSIWEMQALTAASGAGTYSIGSLSGAAGSVVDLLGIGSTLKAGSDNSDTTFAGSMLGGAADSFVKEGAGTLTWVGSTGYQVAPTVTAGTLKVDLSALAGGGAQELTLPGTNLVVQENGTLQLHSGTNTIADTTFFRNGTITGNGTITKTGTGYLGFLFVSNNGVKDFTGLIDVKEGTLANNGTAWAAGAGLMDLNVATGAQFDLRTQNVKIDELSGAGLIARSWTGTSTLIVGNNNGTGATFSGTLQNLRPEGSNGGVLAFTKTGTGTQTLSGAGITYTGATTVEGGRLVLQDTTSFASSGITMNGGTLELKRTSGTWSHNNAITAGTGAGNLVKSGAGTVTLGGTNTYTGTTDVQEGTLALGAAGSIANSPTIHVASGATLDVTAQSAWSLATGQTLTGNGTLKAGTITVESNSILAPGSIIGTLTVDGNLTLSGIANFEVDPTSLADLASVSGLLAFGGTLNVTKYGSDSFAANDSFDLFNWGSSSGTFAEINLPALSGGLAWDQSQLYTTGTLTIIPEPGTALLAGLGAFGLVRRRRRDR